MDEYCGVVGNELVLTLDSNPENSFITIQGKDPRKRSPLAPIDCAVDIKAPEGFGILLTVFDVHVGPDADLKISIDDKVLKEWSNGDSINYEGDLEIATPANKNELKISLKSGLQFPNPFKIYATVFKGM